MAVIGAEKKPGAKWLMIALKVISICFVIFFFILHNFYNNLTMKSVKLHYSIVFQGHHIDLVCPNWRPSMIVLSVSTENCPDSPREPDGPCVPYDPHVPDDPCVPEGQLHFVFTKLNVLKSTGITNGRSPVSYGLSFEFYKNKN